MATVIEVPDLSGPDAVIPVPDASPLARSMQALLDGRYHEGRDLVRWFLMQPDLAPRAFTDVEEHRTKVLEWMQQLADHGGTSTGFPVEHGGEGDIGKSVAGFETLAMGDLSLLVKVGVQFGLFGGAVLHLGTKKHHDKYLEDISTAKLKGCFAMTELGHGSNVQHLDTTATYDSATDEFVIHTPFEHAHKEWIGNAARDGEMAAVFAQLIVDGEQHGVHCLLVPIRNPDGSTADGVRIGDNGLKIGLDGVDNGQLWFDHVRVPRENLLDRYGRVRDDGKYFSEIENAGRRFFTMLGTLIQGRVSVGGAGLNASKVAQVIAVRRGLVRRQFGEHDKPEAHLLDYRVHQRRLIPNLAKTYALHFAQDELREQLHESFTMDGDDPDRQKLETRAAAMKALATWHATATIQECREACGGAGYSRTNRFASLKADTDVFTTFEGDNTVLYQLAAKNLLTDFKDSLGELDPLGMASFIAGTVTNVVSERTGIRELLGRLSDDLLPGRGDDEGDLLDHEVQRELLSWRFDHIRSAAARRLKGLMDSKVEPFEVLVQTQDHVLLVAQSWIESEVLEAFVRKVEATEDPELKELLSKLCSLYALWTIEHDRGWFQEHGRLSSTRSKAVLKAVNHLVGELTLQAADLVDAFGVPEQQLGETWWLGTDRDVASSDTRA